MTAILHKRALQPSSVLLENKLARSCQEISLAPESASALDDARLGDEVELAATVPETPGARVYLEKEYDDLTTADGRRVGLIRIEAPGSLPGEVETGTRLRVRGTASIATTPEAEREDPRIW